MVHESAEAALARSQLLLGPLARGQIEHEGNGVGLVFEARRPDQYGHTAAVLPQILLLIWLDGSGHLQLSHSPCIAVTPFRRRQLCPPHTTRNDVFTVVSYHAQKRVIGLDNWPVDLPFDRPDEDSDDVGVDETTDFGFALFEIAVQTGILERDRRLRGEELQHRDPSRGKGPRREVVLEVEHADELGLIDQGQAENGTRLALADVGVGSKRRLGRGIVENDALAGAQDIVKDRLRQHGGFTGASRISTRTVSPRVVASAAIRGSAACDSTNRPRSAPACSIAVRMSVSISFSSTISPETACDMMITVARSRCSTGAPIVPVGAEAGPSSLRCGYISSSCRTLPSAPQLK